jgi:hypothetical protein
MAEKALTKGDLEQTFKGFEKRQGGKLKSLEDRVDSKLKNLEEHVVSQFHIISEGLIDQIKLLAEGHAGIIERLTFIEKENERQHQETRSLIKLSFTELDRRLTDVGNARMEKAGRREVTNLEVEKPSFVFQDSTKLSSPNPYTLFSI